MVDMAAIAGAISSVKAALDILKSVRETGSSAGINEAVIPIQTALIEANDKLFEAQQTQSSLATSIRELEKEVARLKEQVSDKERYELKQVSLGAFAYMLKESERSGEPPHWLCQNCYDDGKKSVLQALAAEGNGVRGRSQTTYNCARCQGGITVKYPIKPTWL